MFIWRPDITSGSPTSKMALTQLHNLRSIMIQRNPYIRFLIHMNAEDIFSRTKYRHLMKIDLNTAYQLPREKRPVALIIPPSNEMAPSLIQGRAWNMSSLLL